MSSVVVSSITADSAVITWVTDEPATGYVNYGSTSNNWIVSPTNTSYTTSHSFTLSNLASNTLYTFRVYSVDALGNGPNGYPPQYTFTTLTPPDTTPPAAITDLSIPSVGNGAITLRWTAPGDDGTTGIATSYVMKFSTAGSVTESNWSSATPFSGSFESPVSPGTIQSIPIYGLSPGTSYWFAIKTSDEAGNYSFSNSPMGVSGGTASAPAAPNISAEYYQSVPVTVSWGSVSGATSYVLYRITTAPVPGDGWKIMSSPSSNVLSYTDSTVVAGSTYSFKMQACNTSGCSPDSANQTVVVSGGTSGSAASRNNLAAVLEALKSLSALILQIQQLISGRSM